MIAPFRIAAKNSINQISDAYMKLTGNQSTCTVLEYIANCEEEEKVKKVRELLKIQTRSYVISFFFLHLSLGTQVLNSRASMCLHEGTLMRFSCSIAVRRSLDSFWLSLGAGLDHSL